MGGAKRGNAEGSVYARKDGLWAAAVTFPGGRREVQYAQTREAASKKLTSLLHRRDHGTGVQPDRLTVSGYLTQWLDSTRPNVRPKTFTSYEATVRLHIAPSLGRLTLQRLGPGHIDSLLTDKLRQGLSPRTVQYIGIVLRVALGRAMKWGLVPRNVASLVDLPRVEKTKQRWLSASEARRLLDAARGDRLEMLYTTALALGLRQGEALGLRWSDVDLDRQILRVEYTLQRVDGSLRLAPLKTASARRTISLPDSVVAALQLHRANQLEDRASFGDQWHDGDYLFTTVQGGPLDARNVLRSYKRMLKTAKLPPIRFHDLRHSAASLLLAQGVAARVVMSILGHSKIGTTLDTYSHVAPELQREAAMAMDRALAES